MQYLPLSIVMATMAALSATLLGMGQENAWLPALTCLAAIGSVVLTDIWQGFRLNRYVANGAMILAAVFSLYGFLAAGSHQQLLAIGNLLIYVQIVLLFQRKSRRVYGQLVMFSLLQIVVAALLNHSLEFGLLLIVYVVLALSGGVLFFIYREADSVGVVQERRLLLAVDDGEMDSEGLSPLGGPPQIRVLDSGAALIRRSVAWRLGYPVAGMIGATLIFAAAFFFTTPRTGGNHWNQRVGGRSYVGFSPDVNYEELNRILTTDTRVMRVRFLDARTGEPYTVIGEPYMRGVVLTSYFSRGPRSHWQQYLDYRPIPSRELVPPPPTRELVRQDVLLEPTAINHLFSVCPLYALPDTPSNLRVDVRTERLLRLGELMAGTRDESRFSIATTGFRFGSQIPVIPHSNRRDTPDNRARMDQSLRWLRWVERRETLPQLTALAAAIVQQHAPEGGPYAKAKALENHFLTSGAYRYSLDLSQLRAVRNPRLDPLEDFACHHRTGHCAYFAGALALMLRSQGIPARLALGYKGGEFNFVGNYFLIRQRDAHAWVEAYLPLEEIPPDTLHPEERHAGGGWLRLDPTPAASDTRDQEQGVFDHALQSFDYARSLWHDYVLRLDSERQEQSFLGPLASDRRLPLTQWSGVASWRAWMRRVTTTSPRELLRLSFSWRGGLAAATVCALVFLVVHVGRHSGVVRRLFGRRAPPDPSRVRREPVAFYQRFEAILARRGLHRAGSQTQLAFARQAAALLAASPQHADTADLPERIAEAFYRFRYGRWSPTTEQNDTLNAWLARLEQALSPGPPPAA